MTAPAHELGLYFTSRDLTANGQPLPNRTVAAATSLQIETNSITQPTGYWDGATGFFTDNAPDVLRGFFFHVRSWTAGSDGNPGTLQLYSPLPVVPPSASVFRLCKGGKYASSQEIPGLMVSGKQPEFNPASHTSLPGITVTKASPSLGEGTLSINSNARSISAQITTSTGYGTAVQVTKNETGLILYTGGSEGWVRLNVDYALTTTSNVTGTFTLQIPKGVLIPDVEADDAADPNGRMRYYCVAARNNSADDSISALGAWTAPLGTGTATIQSISGETITLTADPTSWPLKGFLIRNISNGSLRYVTNRSGNRLYMKALSRSIYNFSSGTNQLVMGDTLRYNSVTGTSYGKLLDLRITSGSLDAGNASGTMITSAYYTASNTNAFNERTGQVACYMSSSGINRCDRTFTAPGSWAANNVLEAVSDLDIVAVEDGNNFYDPSAVTEKPLVDLMFRPCHNIDERAMIGHLVPGDYAAFWLQQHILSSVPAHSAIMGNACFSWY